MTKVTLTTEQKTILRSQNSDIKSIITNGQNINDKAKNLVDRFVNNSNDINLLNSFKASLEDTRNDLKTDDSITSAIIALFTKVNTVLNNVIKLNSDKIEITPKQDFLGLNIGTLNTKLSTYIKAQKEAKTKDKADKIEADKIEDIRQLEILLNTEGLTDTQELEVIELEAKIKKNKILDKLKADKIEADKKIIEAQKEAEQNTLINMLKLFGSMDKTEMLMFLNKLETSKLNTLNKIMLSLATDEA